MILKLGSTGPHVCDLRSMLRRVGYLLTEHFVPIEEQVFDAATDRCVRAYQEDRGLGIDGEVVYRGGQTWPRLAAENRVVTRPDVSPRARRLSRGLTALYDSTDHRMRPEYRSSSTAAWERMERGEDHRFVVPLASDGSGHHGATCGHAAWLPTSWWMRAMHPEKGIFPTWRTGRGPTGSMRQRFLPLAPVEGVVYGGKLHRGLKEYVERRVLANTLDGLAGYRPPEYAVHGLCHWYICQRDSGHVICVLRVDDHFGFLDPRIGLPAVPGLYRLAADGSKATAGRPWTWRRVRPGETGPWTCYGMADLPASGEIEHGPLAGAPDLPLALE